LDEMCSERMVELGIIDLTADETTTAPTESTTPAVSDSGLAQTAEQPSLE